MCEHDESEDRQASPSVEAPIGHPQPDKIFFDEP